MKKWIKNYWYSLKKGQRIGLVISAVVFIGFGLVWIIDAYIVNLF